jgi:hypothetical protein
MSHARSLHNQPMDGECSSPAGHDEVSPTDSGGAAENRLPLRAMPCSSQRAAGASPCLTSHHRIGVRATTKQARWQVGCYRGSPRCVTSTRAYARGGDDLDVGLRLHPGLGQGVGPSTRMRGDPDRGRRGQIPERLTSTHHRHGGQDVPPTGIDPRHHRRVVSGVCLLASD